MKREGISTLFIHGFPWDLSYLLDHLLFVCFEIVLCVVLKVFCKRGHCLGDLCNNSHS